jgi:23S rRNA pseudouridine1911/1915/1917 synthase
VKRLDLSLIHLHPGLSRRRAREVIEKGQVSVGGETVLAPGLGVPDDAAIRWEPHRKALSRARLTMPVLYRDESILIVDKPAGLLTVPSIPGTSREDTALARVQDYMRRLRPRRPYVGVVHRLDRGTSGALAFALHPAARQALRRLFREHHIERRYVAIVLGAPPDDRGIVDLPIRDSYEGGRRRVARPGEPAHEALTRWLVVERLGEAALIEATLETGRQHQIRVHLAHIGMPVLGDTVYGPSRRPRVDAPRQMLHARLLAFRHPLAGSAVHAESPLPEDFRSVLAALRRRLSEPAGPRRGRRS